MPATAATMVPLLLVLRIELGIWKGVVEPVLLTLNRVEVAKAAVEEEMAKARLLDEEAVGVRATVSAAYGEVVPKPTLPLFEMRILSVRAVVPFGVVEKVKADGRLPDDIVPSLRAMMPAV